MFGYVTINPASLPEEERKRFRSCYCGLCHVLGKEHGAWGRSTLSYDMTFLAMLLSSLYEPDEDPRREARCPTQPWKKVGVAFSEPFTYAADMNIAYAYFKALDDISDEKRLSGHVMASGLKNRYRAVEAKYPEKCRRIRECIRRLSELEAQHCAEADPPANAMGELFAEVYAWKDDFWAGQLHALGGAIGRFIYLCDAYEDRAEDEKKGLYNPLSAYAQRPEYEAFARRILTMVISEGAQAFEMLPLERDAGILRNILYSGVWSRYGALQQPPQQKTTRVQRMKRAALQPARALRRRVQNAKRRTKQ